MSERSGTLADDPFSGRQPTSHERMSGLPWDASYQDGPAPWDIGQPQPAVVRLASEGGFAGTVLDVGCGTGENALHLASLGLSVLGVDVAETALAIARAKADDRGIELEFAAADAFHLERLARMFETVLDCGLFHTFDGEERPAYVASGVRLSHQSSTRSARRVFQRLGRPMSLSRGKWTRRGWMRSSSQRPSGWRLERTTSMADAIRGSGWRRARRK